MTSSLSSSKRGGLSGDVIPKGYRAGQLQQFTPEQMKLFGSMFGHVGPDSYTSRLAQGDEDLFNEMEAPAMRQFSELQGGLASRFSGMGSGARRSSGFQNTSSAAASNFSQDLQSNRQNLQRQAIKDLMGMSSELLGQRPNERFLREKAQKKVPWWQKILGAVSPVGGDMASGGTENTENFLKTLMNMGG